MVLYKNDGVEFCVALCHGEVRLGLTHSPWLACTSLQGFPLPQSLSVVARSACEAVGVVEGTSTWRPEGASVWWGAG